jgi:tetratricopeptide (TPR) repeat protein
VPQVELNHKRSKKPAVIGGLSVLVVVAIVGGVLVLRYYVNLPKPKDVAAQADTLNAQGKYAQAEATLKQVESRAKTVADKALIWSRLAATVADRGDLTGSLKYRQEFDTVMPGDYSNELAEGDLLMQLNRKPEAIAAYQRALAALKKLPSSGIGETPAGLEARIQGLRQ